MARQRLGQHFLADLHWRDRLRAPFAVSAASDRPLRGTTSHCWIEIGSGHGDNDQHLLDIGAPLPRHRTDAAFLPGLRHLAKQFRQPGSRSRRHSRIEHRRDRFRPTRPNLRQSSLLHHLAILHHLFTFADYHRRNPTSSFRRSCASLRRSARHARLRLSSS